PALPALPQERRAVQGAGHEGRATLPPARARGGDGVEAANYAAEFYAAAAQGLEDCPVATGRGDEGNYRRPDRRGLCSGAIGAVGKGIGDVAGSREMSLPIHAQRTRVNGGPKKAC